MDKKLSTAKSAEYLGLRPNTLDIWGCRNKGQGISSLAEGCFTTSGIWKRSPVHALWKRI